MKRNSFSIALTFISVVIMISAIVCSPVISAEDECRSYNWYVKRNADHKQPIADPAMSFIEQYNGYYVDKKHSDESAKKVIYLTFDAGYENGNIAKILDVLKAEDVHAAFFVLSNVIVRNTELVKRMSEEGHLVCNHTSKHRDMTKIHDQVEFADELSSLEKLYYEKTGKPMAKFYRPPEGKFSEDNLKNASELGYKTVFWSFAYADWDNERQPDPARAKEKILANTHNGAIFLFHPTSKTNAAIMSDLIREWKAEGYTFASLEEL